MVGIGRGIGSAGIARGIRAIGRIRVIGLAGVGAGNCGRGGHDRSAGLGSHYGIGSRAGAGAARDLDLEAGNVIGKLGRGALTYGHIAEALDNDLELGLGGRRAEHLEIKLDQLALNAHGAGDHHNAEADGVMLHIELAYAPAAVGDGLAVSVAEGLADEAVGGVVKENAQIERVRHVFALDKERDVDRAAGFRGRRPLEIEQRGARLRGGSGDRGHSKQHRCGDDQCKYLLHLYLWFLSA